jgi:hypothetical protein
MTRLVLPLHECVADSATTEAATDPTVTKSTVDPLHSVANPASSGAALTETFWLCFRL